jgi:hypothetical protein
MTYRVRLNDGHLLAEEHPTRASAHRFIADARLTMPAGRVDPRWFNPTIEQTSKETADMAALTIADTIIKLSAQVNDGELVEIGELTIPTEVTFDLATGTASTSEAKLGAEVAAALRRLADRFDADPDSADLPVPAGAQRIQCSECDASVIGDPAAATIEHGADGSHVYEWWAAK